MDFFDQLQVFSDRYLRSVGIIEDCSPWGYQDWKDDAPIGAVLHYTADNDLDRVLRWFMRAKYGARVSANVVVADRRWASADELMEGLPLIKALPVTVVQCRPVDMPSWHASWTNSLLYGIELLNVGEVRKGGSDDNPSEWVSWRPRDQSAKPWTMPWSHPLKAPRVGQGRYWEPYTVEQVKACVMLLRHLWAEYPSLEPSWVLGHEAVQGVHTIGARDRDKRDPGPHLPVYDIRRAVFDTTVFDYDGGWPGAFEATPDYCLRRQTGFVQQWVMYELLSGWEGRKKAWEKDYPAKPFEEPQPMTPSDEVAWQRFGSALKAMGSGSGAWGVVGKTALRLLGYHVPKLHTDMYDEDRIAVQVFQKLMGLKPDAIPGPRTRKALMERLGDRGVIEAA